MPHIDRYATQRQSVASGMTSASSLACQPSSDGRKKSATCCSSFLMVMPLLTVRPVRVRLSSSSGTLSLDVGGKHRNTTSACALLWFMAMLQGLQPGTTTLAATRWQ